jgi:pimeloyl-ACP methyl ester carboxylesterase
MILLVLVTLQAVALADETTQIRERSVAVGDGISLHCIECGEGEPIVFIHGGTSDYSLWEDQVQAFAREGYRAIAYSRRYNYPNENETHPNHSASVEAADLAGLLRGLNLPRAHIVGHSYGAYTAILLALEHPELVRTLTLGEPPIVPWLTDLHGKHADEAKLLHARLYRELIGPVKQAFESDNDELALRRFLDFVAGKDAVEKLPEHVLVRCRRNIGELKALMASDNRYPDVDQERVRKMQIPTLILSGRNSQDVGRFTDPVLERLIPEASRKRIILDGATHLIWIEQPKECREAVLDFIRGK